MIIIYIFLFLLIIGCLLGIVYITKYNDLQDCRTKIEDAETIIDEALRNKYDITLKLQDIITKEVPIKVDFKELEKLEKENISTFDFDRKLTSIGITLDKIKADYPNLEEIKEYRTLMNDLKILNEKIAAGKTYYNKYTSLSNDLVRKIPSNLIAKLNGISIRTFYDNKDMSDEDINDFKL